MDVDWEVSWDEEICHSFVHSVQVRNIQWIQVSVVLRHKLSKDVRCITFDITGEEGASELANTIAELTAQQTDLVKRYSDREAPNSDERAFLGSAIAESTSCFYYRAPENQEIYLIRKSDYLNDSADYIELSNFVSLSSLRSDEVNCMAQISKKLVHIGSAVLEAHGGYTSETWEDWFLLFNLTIAGYPLSLGELQMAARFSKQLYRQRYSYERAVPLAFEHAKAAQVGVKAAEDILAERSMREYERRLRSGNLMLAKV